MTDKITVSRAVWDEREEALRRLARISGQQQKEIKRLTARCHAAEKFIKSTRHTVDSLPNGYMERIAMEIYEEAMAATAPDAVMPSGHADTQQVHRVGASGFVEDFTKLEQVTKTITACITKTITVKRPEGQFDVGSVFRVIETSEGLETHTYWKATAIEPKGADEIEITVELVASPLPPADLPPAPPLG